LTQLQNYSLQVTQETDGEPCARPLCSSGAPGSLDASCREDARRSVCSAQRILAKQGGLCVSAWDLELDGITSIHLAAAMP